MDASDTTTQERWLPIPGYEGYYSVSDRGNVRRESFGSNTYPGRPVVSHVSHGYKRLTLAKDGKHTQYQVHRLVMAAFVGPCPPGFQVNHKDGNKANNLLSNLEYVTAKDNIQHSIHVLGVVRRKKGTYLGEASPKHALTDAVVREIRRLIADGKHSISAIARMHGVAHNTIRGVRDGITWKHVV